MAFGEWVDVWGGVGELAQDQEGNGSRFNLFFYLCACSLIEPPYVSYFSVFSVCFFSLIEYVLPCQYSMDFLGRFVNWAPRSGVQFRGLQPFFSTMVWQ